MLKILPFGLVKITLSFQHNKINTWRSNMSINNNSTIKVNYEKRANNKKWANHTKRINNEKWANHLKRNAPKNSDSWMATCESNIIERMDTSLFKKSAGTKQLVTN